jgi:hypothetical protein
VQSTGEVEESEEMEQIEEMKDTMKMRQLKELDVELIQKPQHTMAVKSQKSKYPWHSRFLKTYPWLCYDPHTGTASCSQPTCKMYYSLLEETNESVWKKTFETRLFDAHAKSSSHFTKGNPIQDKGQRLLSLPRLEDRIGDEAMWLRIHSVWFLAKNNLSMHLFGNFVKAQLARAREPAPNCYMDDKTAWEILVIMGKYFHRLLMNRVHKSPYYGIMVDETTDRSTTQQLIIYIKFLDVNDDGDLVICVEYLNLVSPVSGSADDITVL